MSAHLKPVELDEETFLRGVIFEFDISWLVAGNKETQRQVMKSNGYMLVPGILAFMHYLRHCEGVSNVTARVSMEE